MHEAHNGKLIRSPAAEFASADICANGKTINDGSYRRIEKRKYGLGILDLKAVHRLSEAKKYLTCRSL